MALARARIAIAQGGFNLGMATIAELLAAWRAAERRWERLASPADVRAAALEVVTAWAAYQDAVLPADTSEFLLVADDDQRYAAATRGTTRALGYDPSELVGLRVVDITAVDLQERTVGQWAAFTAAGRQDGRYRLRAKDGTIVSLRYQARAHHPVPGFHTSRLWPDDEGPEPGAEVP